MKQQATLEQLNELSEKGKEKLQKWWDKTEYTSYCEHCKNEGLYYEDPKNEPLLSIGEMIEFLDENKYWLTIERLNEGWGLFEDPTGRYDKSELCDALWLAVKEVLEK